MSMYKDECNKLMYHYEESSHVFNWSIEEVQLRIYFWEGRRCSLIGKYRYPSHFLLSLSWDLCAWRAFESIPYLVPFRGKCPCWKIETWVTYEIDLLLVQQLGWCINELGMLSKIFSDGGKATPSGRTRYRPESMNRSEGRC